MIMLSEMKHSGQNVIGRFFVLADAEYYCIFVSGGKLVFQQVYCLSGSSTVDVYIW